MANQEAGTVRSGLFHTLDAVLRGGTADGGGLAQDHVRAGSRRLLGLGLLLGVIYGASLGAYDLCHGGSRPALQLLSAAVKLPLTFGLTLLVTFPSLYVFATLMRSPLGGLGLLRLLLVAIVVHLAVLASLGPVFAFFAASTESYPFLLLLHVLFCAIGGLVSLVVLQRATTVALRKDPAAQQQQRHRLLSMWCLLYGTVGAQMGWLLRPFLLAPGHDFSWLCARESNFFAALFTVWRDLLNH
jgi:uncharacterized membrane protein YozB (DUF420 family)